MKKESIADRIFWAAAIIAALSYFTYSYMKSDDLGPNEVRIGESIYAAKNLSNTTFSDGTDLWRARTDEEWMENLEMKQPAYRIIGDELGEGWRQRGLLYNYWAISDERGLAPEGWKVMSGEDWDNAFEHISDSRKDLERFAICSPSSVIIEGGSFMPMYEGEAAWWIEYSRLITEKPAIVGIRETQDGLEKDFKTVGFEYGFAVRCVKKEKTFLEKIGLSF